MLMDNSTSMDNWFYEKDSENKTRFVLGTKGHKPLICFGINPSTAEPNNLDNTLKSVQRTALKKGFDSWLMLNIYPQRSTDPNGMHITFDEKIHRDNLTHIEKILAGYENPTIWAAWGTLIKTRPYLINCLADIYSVSTKYKCNWVTIGKISVDGHPHHPLYLDSDLPSKTFDIDAYVKSTTA